MVTVVRICFRYKACRYPSEIMKFPKRALKMKFSRIFSIFCIDGEGRTKIKIWKRGRFFPLQEKNFFFYKSFYLSFYFFFLKGCLLTSGETLSKLPVPFQRVFNHFFLKKGRRVASSSSASLSSSSSSSSAMVMALVTVSKGWLSTCKFFVIMNAKVKGSLELIAWIQFAL